LSHILCNHVILLPCLIAQVTYDHVP
jgi:hypothetical protein